MLQGESMVDVAWNRLGDERVFRGVCCFLRYGPQGKALQNVTCEQRFQGGEKVTHVNTQNRGFVLWRHQKQHSKAGICLIYVRHSKEAANWGRTPTGGSRISDLRVMRAMLGHRQLFWVRWGPLKVTEQKGGMITWWKEMGKRAGKGENNGTAGQPGSREGHGEINWKCIPDFLIDRLFNMSQKWLLQSHSSAYIWIKPWLKMICTPQCSQKHHWQKTRK